MKKKFVDTNVFIYTLFPIDQPKFKSCTKLFEEAENESINLCTSEWVIAELIWFLQRRNIGIEKTKEIILKILSSKGLEIKNRQWILNVLDIWNANIDFVDAINLYEMKTEDIKEMISYDKDFDLIVDFKRLEP